MRGPGAHAGPASLGERELPEPRRPHGHAGVPGGDGGAARARPHPHLRRPVRRGDVALPPAHPGPFPGLRPPVRFVRQRPAPARPAAASSSATSPSRHWCRVSSLAASAAGIPRAAPMSAGVVMPRSSSSRPIVTRRRRVVSRSSIRARRSAGESLGFAGGDRGGSRSSMGEPLRWAAGPVWIRAGSLRLPDPVRHRRLAPPGARRPASHTRARNSAWVPRRRQPSSDGTGDQGRSRSGSASAAMLACARCRSAAHGRR